MKKEFKLFTKRGALSLTDRDLRNKTIFNDRVYGISKTTKLDLENTFVLNDGEDVQQKLKFVHSETNDVATILVYLDD